MKIGITIGIQKPNDSMYKNGVNMNAIFLQKTLSNLGNTAILLDTSQVIKGDYQGQVPWNTKEHPTENYWKVYQDMDVIIQLGTSLPKEHIQKIKELDVNKKIVGYKCGNDYVIDMERSIHPKEDNPHIVWDTMVDQIWYVPQQAYQNQDYYETIYRLDSKDVFAVPFVWDPMFINAEDRKRKYEPSPNKRLCVYEPNMNVIKYAKIPIMIAERSYRSGYNFDKINIYSGDRLMKNSYVKSKHGWLNYLNLVHYDKDRDNATKIAFHNKFKVTDILYFNDVVISHQWANPLNYAYLDAMYFEYPLIHNAELIQDAGYYYPDFKIGEGSKLLNWVIDNHDKPENIEAYRLRNSGVIERYTVNNPGVLNSYSMLLQDLVNNISKDRTYDWKTNTVK